MVCFKRLLKDYVFDKRGNFSIMFAVGSLMLMSAAGVAVEVTNLQSQKSELQDHLDAAVLALVLSGETDQSKQVEFVKQFIADSGFEAPLHNLTIATEANNEVVLSANITPETHFADLLGMSPDISGRSAAISGTTSGVTEPVDMVLVLDTTESMAGDKIETLRGAANDLITGLQTDGEDGVKLGVVPFSSYVNIGLNNRNAPWALVRDDYEEFQVVGVWETIAEPLCLSNGSHSNPTSFEDGTIFLNGDRVDVRDGTAYLENGQICNIYQNEARIRIGDRTRTREFIWRGCVNSRWREDHLYVTDGEYGTRPVEGNLKANCGQPVLPITADKAAMTNTINSLAAEQDTYMPAGIMWGRRVLSPQEPFTGGRDDVRKVMVLMTDGLNSMRRRRFGDHVGADVSKPDEAADLVQTNADTAELCRLAKADGIEIFSIAFEIRDNITRSMLEDCATQRSMYYNATNSRQLERAFEDIAGQIEVAAETIRITR